MKQSGTQRGTSHLSHMYEDCCRLKPTRECPGWSESLLGAHSFCWFCHVVAHIYVAQCSLIFLWSDAQVSFNVWSRDLPSHRSECNYRIKLVNKTCLCYFLSSMKFHSSLLYQNHHQKKPKKQQQQQNKQVRHLVTVRPSVGTWRAWIMPNCCSILVRLEYSFVVFMCMINFETVRNTERYFTFVTHVRRLLSFETNTPASARVACYTVSHRTFPFRTCFCLHVNRKMLSI